MGKLFYPKSGRLLKCILKKFQNLLVQLLEHTKHLLQRGAGKMNSRNSNGSEIISNTLLEMKKIISESKNIFKTIQRSGNWMKRIQRIKIS